MVLRQSLIVLLLHNLYGKILHLLLDSRYLVEYLEMLDETIEGPKRNLIVRQVVIGILRSEIFSCL